MLVPLSAHGEPQQVFWPHPDRDANLATFRLGLLAAADADGVAPIWLRTLPAVQRVEDDADVVTTLLAIGEVDAGVRLTAVIDPHSGGLVLEVAIAESLASHRIIVELATARGASDVARPLAVALRSDGRTDVAHGAPATVRLITAPVAAPVRAVTLVLGLSADPDTAAAAAVAAAERGVAAAVTARREIDRVAAAGRTPTLVDGPLDVLDRIGLRALRALQDRGGGVLAAPESDPDRRRSGGYGFVWARDLAFIMTAAAVAGQRDVVDGALGWLVRAPSADGLYEQRHRTDATVAPTWGLQLDETGAVLHAIGEVARVLDDPDIPARCWPTVAAGADALARLLHPDTGLPPASLDIWEERVGVHTYTVAATIAGLEAAAVMAQGRDAAAAERWQAAADRARVGLDTHLWSETHGRFLRSRDVARADADGAPVPDGHQPPGRPPHPVASVDLEDATVDASLLGLAYPFAVLAADDPRLVATIDAVERELRSGPGLLRYPGDTYLGGNPWLLTRLWLGLARRAPGAATPADGLAAVAACATGTGLLPEQVDAVTGRPVWVVPLAWSHAFYALACRPDHRAGSGA